MEKVRWGILGSGNIANTFVKDVAYASNAVVQAIASRSLESASEFALKYSIPSAYGSYAELYQDPYVDAIYIATPHNFHLEQSLASLEMQKSVLCEKPITVSPDECVKLIHVSRESEQSVMEAMWTYFLPAISTAKKWVDEGRVGKIRHIKADFGFAMEYKPEGRLYNPDLAGGCLLDMGIYPIALMNLFVQGMPYALKVSGTFAETGVEDSVHMQFAYTDVVASLSSSFKEHLSNKAYLIGDQGVIEIPDFWRAEECKLYTTSSQLEDSFKDGRLGSGFEFQIEAFSRNILQGLRQSAVMPLKTSLRLQNMMALVRAKLSKQRLKQP